MENATPTSAYTHASSTQTASTVHAQSAKRNQSSTRNLPNETVGAVPACPPERSRSGVSIPKILALCAGDERRMRPCGATRAGTQAPPLPISIIFFHAIPHKQNNHLRTIPHKRNQPSTHNPAQTKRVNNLHNTIGGGNASRTPAPSTLNEWNFMILVSPWPNHVRR